MADNPEEAATTIEKADEGSEFAHALLPPGLEFGEKTQCGIIIEYVSSAGRGQLVITQLPLGDNGAIFITAPIVIKGVKFKALLQSKGIDFDKDAALKKLDAFLTRATLSLDAFYYGKGDTQPLLVAVSLQIEGGVIDALVNGERPAAAGPEQTKYDKEKVPVSEIFDITGASVRILKCLPGAKGKLTSYLALLQH